MSKPYNGYLKHFEPVIFGMYAEGYEPSDIAKTLYNAGVRTGGDSWEYYQMAGLRGLVRHILRLNPKQRAQRARDLSPKVLQ
jgi:hypothetical protein